MQLDPRRPETDSELRAKYPKVQTFKGEQDGIPTVVKHYSETGQEPVYTDSEKVVKGRKLETEAAPVQQMTHRLDELEHDYYLFTAAPIYVVALLDARSGGYKMDLVYQFGIENGLHSIPRVMSYQAPTPFFNSDMNGWERTLQGLPKEYGLAFRAYMKQLVLVDRDQKPYQYWRVNLETAKLYTPGAIHQPVEIDVFVPSGIDRRLSIDVRVDGTYNFIALPPEAWVMNEALRFFGATK